MRTITLMTENRLGLLSDISYILGKNRINVEGLDVDVLGEKAVISITVRNSEKAIRILEMNGFEVVEKKGILVKVNNNGENGLVKIKNFLLDRGIKVAGEQLICGNKERSMFSLDVDRPRKANRIITTHLHHGC